MALILTNKKCLGKRSHATIIGQIPIFLRHPAQVICHSSAIVLGLGCKSAMEVLEQQGRKSAPWQ
eukprot:1136809-Pelagomonas_calceolata.AAC.7